MPNCGPNIWQSDGQASTRAGKTDETYVSHRHFPAPASPCHIPHIPRPDPLPDPALCAAKLTLGNCLLFMAAPMPYKAAIQGHRQRPIDLDWLRKI